MSRWGTRNTARWGSKGRRLAAEARPDATPTKSQNAESRCSLSPNATSKSPAQPRRDSVRAQRLRGGGRLLPLHLRRFGGLPVAGISLGRATAVCRSRKFRLDSQRQSAVCRNSLWTRNGTLPLAEILLGQATAECRQKTIRPGDERHSAAGQNSSWTAKTRTGGGRLCASGRPQLCVKAEILSADDFGLPL